jgi:hypothetical protein
MRKISYRTCDFHQTKATSTEVKREDESLPTSENSHTKEILLKKADE